METLSGICIGHFWWACNRIHVDLVYDHHGKPDYDGWHMTEHPNQAYHWNSRAAAYKFLRENPRLAAAGYHVIDLGGVDWPVQSPPDIARRPVSRLEVDQACQDASVQV